MYYLKKKILNKKCYSLFLLALLFGAGKGYSQGQTDSTAKVKEIKLLNIDSTASSPSENPISADSKHSNISEKDSSKTKKNSIKHKLSKATDKEIADNEKLLKDSAKKNPGGDIKEDASNSKESLKTKKDDIGNKLKSKTNSSGDSTKTVKSKAKDKLVGTKVAGVDMQDANNLKKADNDSLLKDKKKQVANGAVKKWLPTSKESLVTKKDSIYGSVKNKFTGEDSTKTVKDAAKSKLKETKVAGVDVNKVQKLKEADKDSLVQHQKKQIADNAKQKVNSTKGLLVAKKDAAKNKLKPPTKAECKIFVKKQVKAIQPHGTISIGYEYGVLPFVAGDNYPSGGFKTEGNVSFSLIGLPLDFTYYYTNIKNVVGLNNYFRLSYDSERYKDQLADKLDIKNQSSKQLLTKMLLDQKQMLKKMEYLKFMERFPDYSVPSANIDTSLLTNYTNGLPALPDSLNTNILPKELMDSTNYFTKKNAYTSELNSYMQLYDSTNNEIAMLKQRIDQIENFQNSPPQFANPYLSKAQQILSSVKKFEIGLCHPTYSTFLTNNIPVQGINLEYSRNNNFLAFTYGTTVNNLLFNTNTIQGTIQTGRNLYNYFDFGNLDGGRKIISLKAGFGNKDESHLYAGFLLGKGRADYLTFMSADYSSSDYSKESNVVVELDAKYKFSEKLSADIIIGKSSLKDGDLTMNQITSSLDEIFSNFRSYAALVRINTGITRTKTAITLTTRWIDPYFKSFGIGFLRSDNLRYEIKVDQPISKKIKYTVSYRREEDNLLKLYDYKNTLQSINNALNIKLSRQLNIRLIYAPLFRELRSSEYSIKDKNDISTIIVSYTPRPKRVNAQFNGLYSRYVISGDSTNINFENVTYTHQFIFRKGFKTGMNVSWFKNNISDTLGNDTYLAVVDIGFQAKRGNSITIGGKVAYKKNLEPQYGFVVRSKIRLYKKLSCEVEMEKIIIGDYYNSFILSKIQQFPYYCNAKLVLNF